MALFLRMLVCLFSNNNNNNNNNNNGLLQSIQQNEVLHLQYLHYKSTPNNNKEYIPMYSCIYCPKFLTLKMSLHTTTKGIVLSYVSNSYRELINIILLIILLYNYIPVVESYCDSLAK